MRYKLFLFIILYLTASPVISDTQLQQQVNNKIKQLNTSLNADKEKASLLKDEVRQLEKKLGELTRKEYATENKIKQIEKKLKESAIKRKELDTSLATQQKGLAQQLQALYSAGEQSHLRLLLKQDSPSDIGRTIKYFEYLNQSRIEKITKVRKTLNEIHTIDTKSIRSRQELKLLGSQLSSQKKSGKNILLKREGAYKRARKEVTSKSRELKLLRQREASLQAKFDGLVARSNRQAPSPLAKVERSTPAKKERRVVQSTMGFKPNKKFSSLRGKLPWPVKGRILHNYGERRNAKQRWKGTVIAAPGGTKVKAIAHGKVEFSGWFNGYGYLVIILHDKNYRSLYGYNRAVYVKVGDIVQGGAVIASIGNSGAQKQNALYFEIRKQAHTHNPGKWCR